MPHVVIYTRPYCGYCTRAVDLLERKGVAFEEIEAGHDPDLRREMVERSGGVTFPQIIIDGTPVGGCDELMDLEREGRLDELLAA